MRFAGCGVGCAEEARGRGSCNAGLGRELSVVGSGRGVECLGVSVIRCTTGGSSLVPSYRGSQRAFRGWWWVMLVYRYIVAHHVQY